MYQYFIHFLLLNSFSLYGNYIILFIHLPADKYLDCFQFLAIMNSDAEGINMQVFV